jgi:hypothetical protein
MSLVRLIGSGAGVIFKGSGFYQTDYRSESYKNAAKKDAPAPVSSEKSAKSETKAESKSETAKPKKQALKKD